MMGDVLKFTSPSTGRGAGVRPRTDMPDHPPCAHDGCNNPVIRRPRENYASWLARRYCSRACWHAAAVAAITDAARLDGDTVRRRRRALGLTQAQLAALAGLSLDTIKSVETGREGKGSPATAERIQGALDRAEQGDAAPALDFGRFDHDPGDGGLFRYSRPETHVTTQLNY